MLPAQMSWYDTTGDDIVDTKELVIGSLRPPGAWRFTQPITPTDQDLFTRIVTEAKKK